jgi:hypothetical protein
MPLNRPSINYETTFFHKFNNFQLTYGFTPGATLCGWIQNGGHFRDVLAKPGFITALLS